MANHGNNKEEKMGRLWMIAFVAVLCTYLFFRWLPPLEPFSPNLFLTQLLFSPFRTWLAFACFLLGVAANGALLSIAVTGTVRLLSGRRLRLGQWLLSLAALGHFYWAFQFHWRLAALFFVFSFFYGMMTLRSRQTMPHRWP
ncbi:hypothetical protein GBL_0634 [Geobacillus kaustophilus GBlys]|uniref:Uncharacterized protein n=2 Tax=Geobacillus thermoleovorans group TaxID=1505648 RepID=U2X1V3_GEOKU|nr:hypothetical protein GBL_0634 [Geobacillus kaustophilus GBlys]